MFNLEIRFSMLHIIFDRFLKIYTNIKYFLYMPRPRILLIMTVHWFLAIACGTLCVILEAMGMFSTSFNFFYVVLLALDLKILISAIATTIYYFKKVRSIRHIEATAVETTQVTGLQLLMSKFKQPCYIVLTYISFNLSSTIFNISMRNIESLSGRQSMILYILYEVFFIVGLASDAFIYTYMDRNVRQFLSSLCSNRNPVHSNPVHSNRETIELSSTLSRV